MSQSTVRCGKKGSRLIYAAVLVAALATGCALWGVVAMSPVSAVSSQERADDVRHKVRSTDRDVATWKELKNHYGWSVRFPRDWEAMATGDETPEIAESPDFQGPVGCYKQGLRCAESQIDFMFWQTDEQSRLTPKEYLAPESDRWVLSQGPICLDGHSGYQVFSLVIDVAGWPHPMPSRLIAVKHRGKMLTISYSESGKDMNSIKSPQDWKLTPVFEQILSTFRFTDDKREDCK